MANLKRLFFPLLLLAIIIPAYWQVIFMVHPLKFDMLDCAYPWRYFISESIRNHFLPLWNPYQNLGYPICSDPQSGAWYPFTWLNSILFGYNIYSIHFEFLFHIYFAGVGMYYLSKALEFEKRIGYILAVSYMLSGFFIGNAQHLNLIISGAWIPFIFASYINLYNKLSLSDALLTAFFSYLLLTGGYAGFSIILFYFLIILFLFFIIISIKNKKYKELIIFIKYHILIVTVFFLLSSVFIASTLEVLPYMSRSAGLSLKQALFNPFSPRCFISFISPFAAVNGNMNYFGTDLSMSNIYTGLIPLIFFIVSFFIKKPVIAIIFLAGGIFSLMSALGEYLPFRAFLFNYIPLMNLFRFPSLFRLFTILFFIILSGYVLNALMTDNQKILKYIKITSIILFITILIILGNAFTKSNPELKLFITTQLFTFSKSSHITQHLMFQGIIQLLLLIIFITLIFFIKNKKQLMLYILILSSTDLIFASQLNSPYTVYYNEFSVKQVSAFSRSLPEGFPAPINKSIEHNSDTTMHGDGPIWRNLNIFQKHIGYDGFASFKLNNYNLLVDSNMNILKSIIKKPPVYFSDNSINNTAKDLNIKSSDTCYITTLNPEKISIKSYNKESVRINLSQAWYPDWKAYINGKPAKIYLSNKCLMSLILPAGNNNIDFIFSSKLIKLSFYISSITLLLIVIVFIVLFLKKTNHNIQER